MSPKDLIESITYILPGFIAVELFRAAYPVRRRGDFIEVAWSIVHGVLIVTIVAYLEDRLFHTKPQSNSSGFPTPGFIASLFVAGIAWGFGLIGIFKFRHYCSQKISFLKWVAPDPQSIWMTVNALENTDWAVVFLNDGSIYSGWISDYKFDPDASDQDFLLSKARRVDDNLSVLYEIDGIGVYLNTKNVHRIEFVR